MNATLTERLIDLRTAPLYTKLGSQGFTHQPRQLDAETWQTEFCKTGGG